MFSGNIVCLTDAFVFQSRLGGPCAARSVAPALSFGLVFICVFCMLIAHFLLEPEDIDQIFLQIWKDPTV